MRQNDETLTYLEWLGQQTELEDEFGVTSDEQQDAVKRVERVAAKQRNLSHRVITTSATVELHDSNENTLVIGVGRDGLYGITYDTWSGPSYNVNLHHQFHGDNEEAVWKVIREFAGDNSDMEQTFTIGHARGAHEITITRREYKAYDMFAVHIRPIEFGGRRGTLEFFGEFPSEAVAYESAMIHVYATLEDARRTHNVVIQVRVQAPTSQEAVTRARQAIERQALDEGGIEIRRVFATEDDT